MRELFVPPDTAIHVRHSQVRHYQIKWRAALLRHPELVYARLPAIGNTDELSVSLERAL